MSLYLFRVFRFMMSQSVPSCLFVFLMLVNTHSVYAEPMFVYQERMANSENAKTEVVKSVDSNTENKADSDNDSENVLGIDAEPKTVLDAVVRQLKKNEKEERVALLEKNREEEVATYIDLELSRTVSEAVVEDAEERLAREKTGSDSSKSDLESPVDGVEKGDVSEEVASRDPRDKQLQQQNDLGPGNVKSTNVRQKARQKKNKLSHVELLTANFILRSPQGRADKSSGWVYLGHFVRNDWLSKTLDIKKSLPKVGRNYTVMHSLNIRVEAPGNKGTAQLIKKLEKDDNVKILKVRPSGRNGHYWAQVEYQ